MLSKRSVQVLRLGGGGSSTITNLFFNFFTSSIIYVEKYTRKEFWDKEYVGFVTFNINKKPTAKPKRKPITLFLYIMTTNSILTLHLLPKLRNYTFLYGY